MAFIPASRGADDNQRVAFLRSIGVLDTAPEATYDDLVLLASEICGTPISLVSLVDQDRQWFKAKIGLDACETHRDLAFCAYAIQNPDELFIVADALADDRFSDNPLVSGEPYVRFYAGAPIMGTSGHALGTLCVIDRIPRELQPGQKRALKALARQAGSLLELRERSLETTQALNCLKESERRLRVLADSLPAMVSHHDLTERFTFANAEVGRVFGLKPDSLYGKTIREARGDRNYEEIALHVSTVLQGRGVSFERSTNVASSEHFYQSQYIPDRDSDGVLRGFYAVTFDISALKKVQIQLEALANLDGLTGLPNRRQFERYFNESVQRACTGGDLMAIILVDVDNFKVINDSHGHAAGDEVLRQFAQRLRSSVRKTDHVARLGGDEFVIVLEGVSNSATLGLIAENIAASIRPKMFVSGLFIEVTASVGVASFYGGDNSAANLLELADRALYLAKQAGRDQVSFV